MAEWPALDSRQYILAFELRAPDCPADFALPAALAGFESGLFLPRDDPDWFGRSAFPPRILLLKDGTLHVVAHPSAGEPPGRLPLDRISAVESAHMLLKGRLRFTGGGFDCTLRYNTRGFPAVSRFLRGFREELLGGVRAPAGPPVMPGATLDLKFANALARELDPEESVVAQFFEPPREVMSRRWLLARRRSMAGDLLALTGRRLLWITDREKGSHTRYGSVARYAPLDAVLAIGGVAGALQVSLRDGAGWQVPLAPENCQHVAEDLGAALLKIRDLPARRSGAQPSRSA